MEPTAGSPISSFSEKSSTFAITKKSCSASGLSAHSFAGGTSSQYQGRRLAASAELCFSVGRAKGVAPMIYELSRLITYLDGRRTWLRRADLQRCELLL